MVRHQGRLGNRDLHRARHPGKTFRADGLALFHRPHADGPHGRQGRAQGEEGRQAHHLPLRRHPRAGAERRTGLRAQARLQRRAHTDGAMPARHERRFARGAGRVEKNHRRLRVGKHGEPRRKIPAEGPRMILQWLTSPEWANVVKALLHTLWQGAVIAVLLGFALRRLANPVTRYRCSLAALGGVMLAGLVTWAVLNRPLPQSISHASALAVQPVSVPMANNNLPPLVVNFSPHESRPAAMPWSAWLAMFWLAGATAMIFRAGFQVAGAEQLRRSSRPLADARIAA